MDVDRARLAVRHAVREMLERSELLDVIGRDAVYLEVDDGVRAYLAADDEEWR